MYVLNLRRMKTKAINKHLGEIIAPSLGSLSEIDKMY